MSARFWGAALTRDNESGHEHWARWVLGEGLTATARSRKLMRVVEEEDLAGVAGKPRG